MGEVDGRRSVLNSGVVTSEMIGDTLNEEADVHRLVGHHLFNKRGIDLIRMEP